MRKILIIFCAMFVGTAYACTTNEIDVLGDGTQCETAKFTITTKNLSANTTFAFYMSAKGTFYVDWGDGVVDTIIRNDTTNTLYNHTFVSAGVKTIRFGGLATEYSVEKEELTIAAIRFGYGNTVDNLLTPSLIVSVSGSLGKIFPTLGKNEYQQPKFPWLLARSNITSIPSELFSGIINGINRQFMSAFYNSSLRYIPNDLFSGITIGATAMFRSTFMHTMISNIPKNLFSGITSSAENMFYQTFYNCANISGYIPPSVFSGLVANGSPTDSGMWTRTFSDTKLATTCPAGTVQYTTGYEGVDTTNYTKWDGYVSCVDENLVCGAGEYLPAHWYQCEMCPENNYCVGGTYPYSETNSSGAIQCSTGLFAPSGMWESAQCGRILHVGDNVVYLRSTKKTSPALHIDIDNDGVADFFGNMTVNDVVMNANTDKKLKLQYGGQTYSVYDDTVNVDGQ